MNSAALRSGMLIVAGMAIIGLIDNFVGIIMRDASLWQFHAFRTLISLPMIWLVAQIFRLNTRIIRPWRVAVRSLILAISMMLYFGSLPLMPIAQAGAGLFTAPIWVLVFSALLFGQHIGPRRLLAVAIGSIGVIAIMKPDAANFSVFTLMPVAAGAFYALANILARRWCADEPTLGVLAGSFSALGLIGAGAMLVLTVLHLQPDMANPAAFLSQGYAVPTVSFWGWTLVQAVGSLVAVGLMTRAYQGADTSYVTIFEYSFLLFASFWGWQLNNQTVDLRGAIGLALIIAAGAIAAYSAEKRATVV
ncbi:MAG: DMT family transporter [Paracoccaceae bacterium]